MDPTIIAIIAAIAAPLGAYLVAARRFSGKIQTTEAGKLWEEADRMRAWSATQIERLESRIKALEVGNEALAQENVKLGREVHSLNDTITELRGEIRSLTAQLKTSTNRVSELEGEPDA